ncbi:surface lipoprotein assembly modifier [Arsukibacterium sp.]|uniref:surface lipoprotein assembly modifier n=1 Tax=Arsukibacterium sp. TaxID=1977258 RepID=UPI003568597A
MALMQRPAMISSAIAMLFSSFSSPGAETLSYTGKARVGGEYQSNVNISALEQASGKADTARLLEAELSASWQAGKKLKLDAGYSIQDKNYQQADDFNTRIQLAYLDASYQLAKHSVGANIYYADATLDNAAFLTLNQASFYGMISGSDSWFIRPALTMAEKSFAQNVERNAETVTVSADSFWFSASGQRFLSVGIVWEDENSRDNAFSYAAPGVRVKVSNRFSLWHYQQQLQLGARLSQRDYRATERSDTQTVIEASWQVNVNQHVALIGKAEHGNFSSSLDSADYRETRTALLFQLGF